MLRSLRAQATMPFEVIVVDQSTPAYRLEPFPELRHHHDPGLGGITAARNRGVDLATGDIILFFDDDAILETDCVREIARTFGARPKLVGAQCSVAYPKSEYPMRYFKAAERVFRHGFFNPHPIRRGTEVIPRLIDGVASAYRRSIFECERFDEGLPGYGLAEDWDITKRAARYGELTIVPAARVRHEHSFKNRPDLATTMKQRRVNFLYLYETHKAYRDPRNRFWKTWFLVGESLRDLKYRLSGETRASRSDRYVSAMDPNFEYVRSPLASDRARTRSVKTVWEAREEAPSQQLPQYERFELRTDRPRSVSAQPIRRSEACRIEPPTVARLREIASRSGGTTFTALLTALLALLHRYSGETDIAIGLQAPGLRTRFLYCDVSADPTFTELLQRTSVREAEAPLVPELERRAPHFSICVTHAHALETAPTNGRAATNGRALARVLPVDLHFIATENGDAWTFACDYDANLFERETIRVLFATLDVLLAAIVADPAVRISRMPLVNAIERERLVAGANHTYAPYSAEQTVPKLISQQVERTPHAVAVVCGERTLTYAELEDASNRLSRELLRRKLGPERRVGILLERSVELVVAMVAVLKAGSTYVPLDPEYPRERLGFIARDAMLAAVISRAELNARFRCESPFVNVDTITATIASHSGEPVEAHAAKPAPAYIIYTSGSTGKPKGVAVSQRSLVNVLRALSAASAFDISARDVHVAVATISFDVATLDVFLPLTCGAKLVIATEIEAADSHALYALLQRSGATFVQATPLTFELLLEAGWHGDPQLKIHCGGDAISRKLADRLLAFGNELWNGYGPTETTITSSLARVGQDVGAVLMGPPIANTQFYVVDRAGELLPPGVAGELYIGGDGVSLGYYGRPDLTRERFVPDTFGSAPREHGSAARMYRTGDVVRRRGADSFEFLGRSDDQIKIRGFRMELAEIEAALLRQPHVVEAVAVVRGSAADEKMLRAYVVRAANASAEGDAWIARLRSGLSDTLPPYMVPASIVVLDALPRTLTGKVDRRALSVSQAPGARLAMLRRLEPASAEPSASRREELLVSFASELLGRESIGRDDDIFTLGFDSLSAMRLADRIEGALRVRVALRTIYEAPTMAQLALRIDEAPPGFVASEELTPIVLLNERGTRLPFVYFHNDLAADGVYCRRLARALGNEQPLYAIAPHGAAGLPLRHVLEDMARDYLPRIRELQASGPYRLGGLCAGGLVAYEVARLLRAQGEIVERLVLVNSWPLSKRASGFGGRLIRALATERRLPLRFRENFCYNVEGLFDAAGAGPRGVFAFFVRRTRTVLRRAFGLPKKSARVEVAEKPLSPSEAESVIAHLVAPLAYRPRTYDGDLTVLWSTDEARPPGDARAMWESLAKTTRVLTVPGRYRTLMQDGVEDLGAALKSLLAVDA